MIASDRLDFLLEDDPVNDYHLPCPETRREVVELSERDEIVSCFDEFFRFLEAEGGIVPVRMAAKKAAERSER